MSWTLRCDRCGRDMYRNEAHTVSVSSGKTYIICPDCNRELCEFISNNNGDMIKQSMTLREINKMLREKASTYAQERYMMLGFPQRLALPGVMA